MLQFCWQWSHNVRLVNTIQIRDSLLYAACFVSMVMEWESPCPLAFCGGDRFCWVTIVTKHLTYGKLFWFLINFTWWTFWDHCQQNWSIFTCLTPVEPKSWPLTFSSITTKRYVVDRSNYTFSESVWQEESVGMVFDKIEATFEFDPCTNYFVTPGLLYRKWHGSNMKYWSLAPYQHNKITKPCVTFQLSKSS